MSRIDEIRNEYENVKELLFNNESHFTIEDIGVLLSKIVIAEKALTDAKEKTAIALNKMSGGRVERHVFEDTRVAYQSIDEALQQLRE